MPRLDTSPPTRVPSPTGAFAPLRCPSLHAWPRLAVPIALWVASLVTGPRAATAGCHVSDRPSIAFSLAERGRIEGESRGAGVPRRLDRAQVSPAPCDADDLGVIGPETARIAAWGGVGVVPDPPAVGSVWLPVYRRPTTHRGDGPVRPPRR